MKIRLLPLFALWPLLAVPAMAQTERTVAFRNGPKVAITVPMGYSFESKNNSDGSVSMRMENPIWNIEIDALVAFVTDPEVTKREWQQSKLIEHMADSMSRAQEDDYKFKALVPSKGSGVYCTFSSLGAGRVDAPQPGMFTHITGGVKAWPRCVVLFKIRSNGTKSPEYLEALELFNWSFTE